MVFIILIPSASNFVFTMSYMYFMQTLFFWLTLENNIGGEKEVEMNEKQFV